ncbi:hypothetical protein [Vulgatibacter incomptus]|nr:hypothetical protein [Vulgatibacter incomptus]
MSRVSKIESNFPGLGLNSPGTKAVTAEFFDVIKQHPGASKVINEITSAVRGTPVRDQHLDLSSRVHVDPSRFQLDPKWVTIPQKPRVRVPPFDFSGQNAEQIMVKADSSTGTVGLAGRAGHIRGANSDDASGTGFVGIRVTAKSTGLRDGQTLRVAPLIRWDAVWHLSVLGIREGFVGAEPLAWCRGGVDLMVFDSRGLVTRAGRLELFSVRHKDTPGVKWSEKDDVTGAGLTDPLHVSFPIPPGETRFVNIDAFLEVGTKYSSIFNLAASQAGMTAQVMLVVLDPE